MTGDHGAHQGTSRYAWLSASLAEGATVLTASRRLARELRTHHDSQQIAAGKSAWRTPDVVFWQDWLARALQDAHASDAPVLVENHVAGVLWETQLMRVLDQSLLVQAGFVRQAQAAWQRLLDWKVPLELLERHARRPEERAFARAAVGYQRELQRRNWLDSAQLAGWGAASIARASAPARIVYAGFDRISPAAGGVLETLAGSGIDVRAAPTRAAVATPALHAFPDTDAELRAAGSWARQVLAARPGARIAVVATHLENQPAEYARLLREGLVPGWQRGGEAWSGAVDVSYGKRLADYPAVATALSWLRWLCRDLSSVDISLLLRSPFLQRGDQGARARLELELRGIPDRNWPPGTFAAWGATRSPEGDAADWLRAVQALSDARDQLAGRAAPSLWAERVDRRLAEVGWPGAGSLTSGDFQLVNRWRHLLNEYAALDRVLGDVSALDAVTRLGRMAADTVFQPETAHGLIQLMGALEAAGLEFDHLWISGMDSGRWPPPAHPLALVSTRLQRDFGMPDSTPADSLAYSRRVLRRLGSSASDVRLSWSRTNDDSPQAASRLLDELPVREEPAPVDPGWYAGSLVGLGELRVVADDPVPAVRPDEKVAGGAYTVQRQLSEPFSAFATGRLGIPDMAPFEPGIAARLRGTATHAALDALYAHKPDQGAIRAWDDAELADRIGVAADAGLRRHFPHADPVLRRMLALEELRVRRVLARFVEFERSRQPFAVQDVEQRIAFAHAGVNLGLRADRLDRMPDGRLLVIDYKTGAIKPLIGTDGNPSEMQLVVYALALGADVGSMALFYVGSSGTDIRAAGDCEWDRTPADQWPERIARWKGMALSAIEAIAAGDARVNLSLGSEQSRPLNVLSRAEELKRDL